MRSNLLGADPMCREKANYSRGLSLNPEIRGLMEIAVVVIWFKDWVSLFFIAIS